MTASVSDTRRRWIDAGVILAKDARAKVACPTCGNEYLQVEDVQAGDEDGTFARYLRCARCGSVEILDRLRAK